MKTRYYLMTLAAALMLLPAQSCLKDTEDVFETSSSVRMEQYVKGVSDILLSQKTWFMDYYAGTNKQYGGYAYVLEFDKSSVTATSELDPENSYKSFYKYTYDNGPVLSFDTNNPVLHFFATPSSDAYEAYNGDFEYLILDYSKERITLLGKRSGNQYYLLPYDTEDKPLDYISKVSVLAEEFHAPTFEGTIGEIPVSGTVDINNRWITFVYGDGEEDYVECPFVFTDKGMRFYEPVVVNGCTINYLWYVSNNNLLTNGVFTLYGKLPDDYMPYSGFEGDFVLAYNNGSKTVNVTLTPNDDRSGYIMSGLSNSYTVKLIYDKGLGRLHWQTQAVGLTPDGNTAILCPWSLSGGGVLTWSEGVGVTIHWVEKNGQFEFEDNGVYETPMDSFILYEFSPSGSALDECESMGLSRLPYLTYMKRR